MSARAVADTFDAGARSAGPRLAVRDARRDVTFESLRAESEALSRVLAPFVAVAGQRVALLLPNSAGFVAAFFAAARLGAVVAPLNPGYRAQELRYSLGDLDAAAVVTLPQHVAAVAAVLPELPRRPAIVAVTDGAAPEVVDAGTGRGGAITVRSGAPLLQQYTSGSTGRPKRVVRTHEQLTAELEALRTAFGVGEGDRFLGLAPFSHVNGLVRTMLTSMHVGAALYPFAEFKRREVLDVITRDRLTFFGGVPQMYALLAETPARGAIDLHSLRVAFSSSAPLLPADANRFHATYGVAVRGLYGSTETGTISFDASDVPDAGSVGRPLAGVRCTVVDERGAPVPAGQEGEIVVESPFAAGEYAGNPEATAEAFREGRYVTGDLGRVDARGAVTLTGRKKLLINRGGFKVNPYEVEDAIRSHPKVSDVAVVGKPGRHGDDVVAAYVVADCTPDEILSHCRERLADYKVPARVELRPALPKGPTGKILRGEL